MNKILLSFTLLLFCAACKQGINKSDDTEVLFRKVPSSESNIHFNNVLAENDSVNIFTYQYLYNGAGVAAADFNNDGLTDLFFSANFSPCKLYFNKGNFKFEDVTQKAGINTTGWCSGVSVVDINNDGFDDLYVCRSGPTENKSLRTNLLYVNQKDGTFKEQAQEYGIADDGHSTQAFFFDYDLDNDLDLFVLNHSVTWEYQIKKQDILNRKYTDFTTPRFYRNDDGRFTDVSEKTGIMSNAFCLAAVITDINNDGYPDMYVCNDYIMNDFLYINQKDGTFKDQVYDYFPHTSYYSMGVDVADFNNDGLQDIYSLDMLPERNDRLKMNHLFFNYDQYMVGIAYGFGYQLVQNTLHLNNGDGTYSDIADMAGVARTDWSWATLFGDLDNDGYKDLVVTNGYRRDFTNKDFLTYRGATKNINLNDRKRIRELIEKMPTQRIENYAFRNKGDLTFANVGANWGMNDTAFSNGLVIADLNNDGDLDVVMNNIDDEAFIYDNQQNQTTKSSHYLSVKLKTDLAHAGFGTIVKVVANGTSQILDYQPTRGYLSSSNTPLHFGLGNTDKIDSVVIYWNDGFYQALTDIKSDTLLTIKQERTTKKKFEPLPVINKLLEERNGFMQPAFVHEENNDFIDYKREPLLTKMYSKEGPQLATGDVNGDGLDDLFIGGAKSIAAALYLQTADGKFVQKKQEVFAMTFGREDMGSVLFDADKDGDKDLYVVSGSNEIEGASAYYNDQLFINDGKGNFSRCPYGNIPFTEHSGSCVTAGDVDGDGDMDLFRGGRFVANKYPLPSKSYILVNDGTGKFTDATNAICPELEYPGMVTAAKWTDFDKDGKNDLVVLGDWMPILFFKNEKNRLVNVTTTVMSDAKTNGCWLSVFPTDVDGDGDEDFICGNQGLNTRFRTTPDKPSVLHYGDFDKNGSTDAILTSYYDDGKMHPYFPADNYIDQMRYMRKRFNSHEEFFDVTFETMFTDEERKTGNQLTCHRTESVWLRNDNGKFEIVPLPMLAQTFPTYGAIAFDADGDSKQELILTGNCYNTEVNSGRMDAGKGSVLRYNPQSKNLEALPTYVSGFNTPLDAKSIAVLNTKQGGLIVVGNNSGRMQVFKRKATTDKSIIALKD